MVHRYPRYDAIEEGQPVNSSSDNGPSQESKSAGCWKFVAGNVLLVAVTALAAALATHAIEQVQWREIKQEMISDLREENFVPNTPSSAFPKRDSLAALREESTVENVSNGAVATDDGRCSDVGLHILRDLGGNAVDAAVTVALCLQVVNPSGSSLGGGGMMLLHTDPTPDRVSAEFEDKRQNFFDGRDGKKVTEVIDFRETAPARATANMFDEDPDKSWNGGLAIATPAQLRGLELAHSRHGLLPWAEVVRPAVSLARDGVEVTPYLAHAINLKSSVAKIFRNEHLAYLMTKNNDGKTLLQNGDIMTNPMLAKTFEAIMERGADAIYKGEVAEKIALEIQEQDGIITTDDLANYKPTLRDPLVAKDIGGFTMVGVPPPSSGGATVIGAARFLAGYKEQLASFKNSLTQHRLVEAMRHAYAIRMSFSDPAYFPEVTAGAVADLINGTYIDHLRSITLDDDVLHMSQYGGEKWGLVHDDDLNRGQLTYTEEGNDNRRRLNEGAKYHRELRGFQYLEDHGTTHVSIVDKDGNAVTYTTTINTYFGSGVASPSTGIIFNSQMDDFSSAGAPNHYGLAPSESNYIVPGKKPLSSVAPTLVFHPHKKSAADDWGKLRFIFGCSGGPKIPTATLQVFVNHILLGMPLYEAIASPRLHDQLLYKGRATTLFDHDQLIDGPKIEVGEYTKNALLKRGHTLFPVSNTGTSQAVSIDPETGKMTAVSDPRKGGRPAGY